VNHNHFAGYVGMVIPIALALATYIVSGPDREDAGDSPSDLRIRVPSLREPPEARVAEPGGLLVFATVILVVALLFSLSRED